MSHRAVSYAEITTTPPAHTSTPSKTLGNTARNANSPKSRLETKLHTLKKTQ